MSECLTLKVTILYITNRKFSTIGINVHRRMIWQFGYLTSVKFYMAEAESYLMKLHNFKSLIST